MVWKKCYMDDISLCTSNYLCLQLCLSDLVESIKMVELMDKSYKCQKMIRGRQGSVIPSSYIVMMKENSSMSEMVSEYIQH